MHRIRPVLFAFASLLLSLLPGLATGEEAVKLDFVNADVEAVVKAIGEMTGRTFVLDPKVRGTVNVVSGKPVPRSLVYPMLQSALRAQGFVTVEGPGFVRIIPEAEGKTNPTPVIRGSVNVRGDQLVTQVYTLKNESAAQLVNILRPLITPNNTIAAYASTNTLIITDYADNLRRIERIIETIDNAAGAEPVIVPIRNASAMDLAQTLNRILAEPASTVATAAGEPSQRVLIIPDPRSNSILLRSENPLRIARVRTLIEQLDTPTSKTGNVHILYLKNADATKVAQTLRAVMTGEAPAVPAPATPFAGPAMTPLAASAAASAAAGQQPSTVANPFQPASTPTGGMSASGVTIQADTTNNALIINAPEPIYNNLRAVVELLDVRRAQVFVEVLVVEVTAERAAEFGIQWQALDGINRGSTQVIGGTNFGARGSGQNIIDAARNLGSVGPGLNLGVVRGQVFIPGIGTIANLGFLARALEADVNANILSTPNLLTLDNEAATVVVGQNVPFITGQYAQTGSATTATPFQTVERKDVGLTLRIKPQVSDGGAVRLQIYQEVSSVQDQTNPAGVITNKRSVESMVLADDGQIVVIGGLVQDSTGMTVEKVPLLGDVPVLGALFRYETRKQTKTNLMVFLRPLIMRESTSYRGVTSERYRDMLEEQERAAIPPRAVLPDIQTPRLPPEAFE